MSPLVGYPDWQRIVTYDGQLLVNETAQTHNASQTYGPFDTINWAAIELSLLVTAGSVQVTIESSPDATFTRIFGRHTFVASVDVGFASVIVPVYGPKTRILVALAGGAASYTASLVVATTQRLAVDPYGSFDLNVHDTDGPQTIGAGLNLNLFGKYVYNGPVQLWVNNGAQTLTVALARIDSTGAYRNFYSKALAANAFLTDQLILPPYPVRMQLSNTGGANDTVQAGTYKSDTGAS